MKRFVIFCSLIISFYVSIAHAYLINRTLYLQRVQVQAISSKRIKLSGTPYSLAPNVKVGKYDFTHGDQYKGAGRLSDIRIGELVYARVDGTAVIEIMIERK